MKKLKDLIVIGIGALCVLYLLNIDAGIFEFLPDNLPLVGNLDEVAATAILIRCLAYFGVDLKNFFKRPVAAEKKKMTVDV